MKHPSFMFLTILMALALAGPAAASSWQEQSITSIPAAGIRTLRVENARGTVNVTRGSGSEIRLTALKIVRSNDERWARRVSRETQVTTETQGGEYIVQVRYPQRQAVRVRFWDLFSDFELPRIEVRLALDVPDGISIVLKSTSGDLTTEAIRSPQAMESTSGDVRVSRGGIVRASSTSGDVRITDSGAAQIRTVSGDVVAERIHGALAASTTSGDLTVKGAMDSLQLRTVSGEIVADVAPHGLRASSTSGGISVHRAAGPVQVETASGDVRIGLEAPLGSSNLVTASGELRLDLLSAVACVFDLSTSSGEIHVEAPLDVQKVTRHRLQAVLRHGTIPVVGRTASGDISIAEEAR